MSGGNPQILDKNQIYKDIIGVEGEERGRTLLLVSCVYLRSRKICRILEIEAIAIRGLVLILQSQQEEDRSQSQPSALKVPLPGSKETLFGQLNFRSSE